MKRSVLLCTALCSFAAQLDGQQSGWQAEVLFESEHGLGGAAIGDLDPEGPGNEVAVVSANGEAWMVKRSSNGWASEQIYRGDGELIMCAIGDVHPAHPGNEFIGVGMVRGQESLEGPGQVVLVRKSEGKWVGDRIFEDSHMIHGVAIGDVSARSAGNEVIACGFNHRVTLLRLDGGQWSYEVIYVGNDRMKIAVIADVLPERDGLEVLVSGSDGNVVLLWEGPLGWKHEIIYSDSVGQSRISWTNAGVLIGGDDGKVTLARRIQGRWKADFLFRDSGKIRGVATGDVDRTMEGDEFYACGYSRRIIQMNETSDGFWRGTEFFQDEKPLHHLVAGELDPNHPGLELVACGHGGRLLMLRR